MWVEQKNYKVLGKRFSGLRKEAGLNQSELARAIGKPQSFVSSYEAGQRRIDVLEFLILADALEVPPHKAFARVTEGLSAQRRPLRKLTKPGAK